MCFRRLSLEFDSDILKKRKKATKTNEKRRKAKKQRFIKKNQMYFGYTFILACFICRHVCPRMSKKNFMRLYSFVSLCMILCGFVA